MASVGDRRQGIGVAVWRFVRGAPLTYSWLVVLLVTTIIQHLDRREYRVIVVNSSTNIRHLLRDPLEVLASSLFLIDGRYWLPYLALFTLFLAPAEHWLGQLRWLTVGLTAHVSATYISEGLLFLAIRYHDAPQRLMHSRDIGVSYFLVGMIAVLTYRIASPWRWAYLSILVVIFGVPLTHIHLKNLNFTAIGHFTAIFIGLCCYPIVRRRKGDPINPARLLRSAWR